MKPMIVLMFLMLVIGISVTLNAKFARQDNRYEALVTAYECYPWPCIADFNGNGTSDRLQIIHNPSDRLDSRMVVLDGERELFRRPYVFIDGTLRTHSAIRAATDGVRLLIFDGTSGQHVNQVYLWNGERMAEITPSSLDREILSAMAARDDTGSWDQWVTYYVIRDLYFPLLTILTVGVVLCYAVLSLNTRPAIDWLIDRWNNP